MTKCVYSVLGINMEGQKEILGTWISENESASFYASICSDLRNRGVSDIFIACHDNLTGLCDAINAVFPKTKNQLQIATPPGQQGRNSRSSRDIIPGQQKLVKKRDNIISPAVFHRQERREAQASACGKLPAVTKAAPQCGLS